MAIKKLNKAIQVASADSSNNGSLFRAAIFPVDTNGKINKTNMGIFLLNPASIDEEKSANWSPNSVPGQSDPPLQWISSGPRIVSFDALVTAETSDLDLYKNLNPSNGTALTATADIASSFFKVTIPTSRTNASTDPVRTKLDVSARLEFYRSLLYPTYDLISNGKKERRRLASSPPLVTLWIGSSLSKKSYGDNTNDYFGLWVITNLRIKITKQLPNLSPLEAVVSFSLMQYTRKSISRDSIYISSKYESLA